MKIVELEKVAADKKGRIDEHDADPKPHERDTAEFLADFGFNIDFIKPSNAYKSKNPDFLLNGAIWETKSPVGSGNSTVDRQFHRSNKQAHRLVLDLRRIKLPARKAERQAIARFERSVDTRQLMLITKDGKLLDIKK